MVRFEAESVIWMCSAREGKTERQERREYKVIPKVQTWKDAFAVD